MVELTKEQIADLHELQQFCAELKADLVIIGAIAYQYHFPREERHTGDIDSAVALDLDDFAELERRLQAAKWGRTPNREHRWRSLRGTLLDLIPELRKAKQVTWPESQFTMSLVGFDHVFADAEAAELAPKLILKIIPSIVLVLLKIVAFLDDQQRRAKDLLDIRSMLFLYEEDSERIFSDVVLDAKLADFSLAKAPHSGERDEEQARAQFDAFEKGLNQSSEPGSHGSSKKNGKEEKPSSTSSLDRLQPMARECKKSETEISKDEQGLDRCGGGRDPG